MGVGSIATTQLVKAVGRGQLSAIYTCAKLATHYGVPVLADGGIKNTGIDCKIIFVSVNDHLYIFSPGCIIKALAMGASCVIMGSLLAGVDESPGEYFFQDGSFYSFNCVVFTSLTFILGVRLKHYRANNSRESHIVGEKVYNITSSDPSYRLAAGVSGAVVDKGPLNRYIPYLCQSIRHGLFQIVLDVEKNFTSILLI